MRLIYVCDLYTHKYDSSNTNKFVSSNTACDIVSTEMVEGTQNYEYELNDKTFTATIKDAPAGKVGTYNYKIEATAEGGAKASSEAKIEITE